MNTFRKGEHARVMNLLRAGIPLSLLLDLATPPNSAEVFIREVCERLPTISR